MRAIGMFRSKPLTDPDALQDVELPAPELRPRDLLVRVKAVSVNPVDTKVRGLRVKEELTTPRVLGFDGAGIVETVGPECTMFKPGDAVYFAGDVTRNGSNAELVAIDERIVARKPASLDFPEAAALPLTTLTAWEAIHERIGFSRDPGANAHRSLLIINGAGGVGSIAIQLAKLAGLTVIATASRPESAEWCRSLGADHVIDHRDLAPALKQAGFPTVDAIFCCASTDSYFKPAAELIAPQGTVCFIVANAEPADAAIYQPKSVRIAWEYMFTRPQFTTPDILVQHEILSETARLVDEGLVRTTLTRTLEPINAATLLQAHQLVESGKMVGKVVVAGEFRS
ncbi:zinc-binding alcohol dehydrogenase family protein [Rhodoligotrophos defluvii]|uniref:zinc-binding alcohol dehydrogenase family protein n=1 Tax=Rhodoligotrophos defluvii TaxID=2561934 RepID=UPI0010C946A8|nr:zinc-binding alcohol dehydrogenase family protein [Rhodoligotrophos defluvii]